MQKIKMINKSKEKLEVLQILIMNGFDSPAKQWILQPHLSYMF